MILLLPASTDNRKSRKREQLCSIKRSHTRDNAANVPFGPFLNRHRVLKKKTDWTRRRIMGLMANLCGRRLWTSVSWTDWYWRRCLLCVCVCVCYLLFSVAVSHLSSWRHAVAPHPARLESFSRVPVMRRREEEGKEGRQGNVGASWDVIHQRESNRLPPVARNTVAWQRWKSTAKRRRSLVDNYLPVTCWSWPRQ